MLNFLEDKPTSVDYLKDINAQDKLQSAIELEYLKNNLEFENLEFIIEIGAGYGRIPECLINNKVKKTYIIIDIPPALYLSQKYLLYKFSNHKILKYNTKLTHQILKENLRSFDLIFLSLHQMTFLKNILPVEKTISIFINVLQEIPKDTILEIFKQLKEISKYSYIKSVNSNVNNPYKEELLNFDHILKILNEWKIINKNPFTFPSTYSEAILINKQILR
jgi:putative sugar O-methyltransferase